MVKKRRKGGRMKKYKYPAVFVLVAHSEEEAEKFIKLAEKSGVKLKEVEEV